MRIAEDGNLLFFHRLEHRRLSFRRRSVDLVGKNNMREDRSALELKFAPTAVLVNTSVPTISEGMRSGVN